MTGLATGTAASDAVKGAATTAAIAATQRERGCHELDVLRKAGFTREKIRLRANDDCRDTLIGLRTSFAPVICKSLDSLYNALMLSWRVYNTVKYILQPFQQLAALPSTRKGADVRLCRFSLLRTFRRLSSHARVLELAP